MKPTLVILAAGTGSRYGGLKQLEVVGPQGEALLDYAVYDALQAGFGKIVLVVRQQILETVKAHCENTFDHSTKVDFVIQETELKINGGTIRSRRQPPGTGHAVLSVRSKVNTPFAVVNADDYYGPSAYQKMADFLTNSVEQQHFAMIGYLLDKTLSDNGAVSRGICKTDSNGVLINIDEHQHICRGNHGLSDKTLVSMNFWGFHPVLFATLGIAFEQYLKAEAYKESEFLLPAAINQMIIKQRIKVSVIPSDDQWYGITYAADKAAVQLALRQNRSPLKAGW